MLQDDLKEKAAVEDKKEEGEEKKTEEGTSVFSRTFSFKSSFNQCAVFFSDTFFPCIRGKWLGLFHVFCVCTLTKVGVYILELP